MSKRGADAAASAAAEFNTLRVRPLGGGTEVGRSCLMLTYKGLTIMLDCGILPSFSGVNSLPLLHEFDPATVDAIIITCVAGWCYWLYAPALPILTPSLRVLPAATFTSTTPPRCRTTRSVWRAFGGVSLPRPPPLR